MNQFDSMMGEVKARGGALDHREWIVYKGEQALLTLLTLLTLLLAFR